MNNKIYIFFFILIILFCSCEKDDPAKEEISNRVVLDSSFIISRDLYLWNTEILKDKNFNPQKFSTPVELLVEFRKYSPINNQGHPIDNWTFAIEKEKWNNLLQGNSDDFGCSFRFKDDDDLRISYVQENSAAGKNGLYRGLKVLSINNINAISANVNLLTAELNEKPELAILYFDKKDEKNKLTIIKKSSYIIDPVMVSKYFIVDNKKLGYINFSTFLNSENGKLKSVFTNFKNNNIKTMIIDLRYNGGGLTSVMEEIANMLAPLDAIGKTMYTTKHNSIYSMFDSSTLFSESNQRLDLNTIYFIVSPNTASSSEMLINSIRPYVNTFLIGQKTHGKLVGMYTIPFHNYILAPVSFKTYNAKNESLDTEGFDPSYFIDDDVENDFDEKEACINAALYHYQNNGFSTSKINSRKSIENGVSLTNFELNFAVKDTPKKILNKRKP